ncbi:MAG: hypothetical protein BGO55_08615 [Sphingobacteriales bacterium 50-39]|nr:TlpA family protein disulfide reductase [Sphingobacteriales bacterium]OJW59326.1 MAG: hypothetical protein BGO55_08615 [Sphingobacteriales bacterium 50-39]
MYKLFFTIFICAANGNVWADVADTARFPKEGESCPNFHFEEVIDYTSNRASINDFKGKWLIVDCWNEYCSGCLASMPNVNSLSTKFRGVAQFLLVAYTGSQYSPNGMTNSNNSIRMLYKRIQQKYNLHVPIAFDSLLFKQFGIYGCPFILIISPDGIVKYITFELNSDDLAAIISGQSIQLPKLHSVYDTIKRATIYHYDSNSPFLLNRNGGEDSSFIFRSLLSTWNSEVQPMRLPLIGKVYKSLDILGADLVTLYKYAYFGKGYWDFRDSLYAETYPIPIFETSDSLLIRDQGRNLFCYSLTLPPSLRTREKIMAVMRNDLGNYFGYHAYIEKRLMPYYRLVATARARHLLKAKAKGLSFTEIPNGGFVANDYSIRNLIGILWSYHQNGPPFVDCTRIHSNIDIAVKALMVDINDVRRSLRRSGLDLKLEKKAMNVLVIRHG